MRWSLLGIGFLVVVFAAGCTGEAGRTLPSPTKTAHGHSGWWGDELGISEEECA